MAYNVPGIPAPGSVVVKRRTVAGGYVVADDDHELWVTSAGDVTIPGDQNIDGRRLVVHNRVLAGGGVRLVSGGGLLNAQVTRSLLALFESVTLTGDGTNWACF